MGRGAKKGVKICNWSVKQNRRWFYGKLSINLIYKGKYENYH